MRKKWCVGDWHAVHLEPRILIANFALVFVMYDLRRFQLPKWRFIGIIFADFTGRINCSGEGCFCCPVFPYSTNGSETAVVRKNNSNLLDDPVAHIVG